MSTWCFSAAKHTKTRTADDDPSPPQASPVCPPSCACAVARPRVVAAPCFLCPKPKLAAVGWSHFWTGAQGIPGEPSRGDQRPRDRPGSWVVVCSYSELPKCPGNEHEWHGMAPRRRMAPRPEFQLVEPRAAKQTLPCKRHTLPCKWHTLPCKWHALPCKWHTLPCIDEPRSSGGPGPGGRKHTDQLGFSDSVRHRAPPRGYSCLIQFASFRVSKDFFKRRR